MNNNVLIVGLGQIGLQYDLHLKQDEFSLTHSRAFSSHKNFNLLAGVDNDNKQRDIFSQSYSLPTYSSLTKALKAHNPDIVVVATSTKTHAEILYKILKSSNPKIILCEKPLSYSLSEAQNLYAHITSEDGRLQRGAKSLLKSAHEQDVFTLGLLYEHFGLEAGGTWDQVLDRIKPEDRAYASTLIKRGVDLNSKPKTGGRPWREILIGT